MEGGLMVAVSESGKPRRNREGRRKRRLPEWAVGYLFILPALIGFVLFYLLPTVRAMEISLTDWNMLRAPRFIGFDNYVRLFSDPKFWDSLRLTLLYVVYNIPVQTALGLLIAVLADRLARGVTVRAIIIAPYLLSNVVAALIWLMMLDPLLGLTNHWLEFIGVARQGFLSSRIRHSSLWPAYRSGGMWG